MGLDSFIPPMSVNSTIRVTELTTPPPTTHGLNLPHLVVVLSTMLPMNGSMNSSTMRSTAMIVVTYRIMRLLCAVSDELNRCEVRNMIRYVDSVA